MIVLNESRFLQQEYGKKVIREPNVKTSWNGSRLFAVSLQISFVYSAARGRAEKRKLFDMY